MLKKRHAFFICWLILLVAAESATIAEELPSWSPPPLDGVADSLAELSFDAFSDEVSELLLLYAPSALISYGLTSQLHVRNDRLTPAGPDAIRTYRTLANLVLDGMTAYDTADLSFAQTVTFNLLREFLEPIAAADPQEPFFWQSVNPTLGSNFFQLERFFEDISPRMTSEDLDDFIVTLWQVDDLISAWREEIELDAEAGILPPRFSGLQVLKDALYEYRSASPIDHHPYYQIGLYLLCSVDNLTSDYVAGFIDRLTEVVRDSIVPAFDRLYNKMDVLMRRAPWQMNWQNHSAWPACYRSQLRSALGIELAPETIHAAALAEADRLAAELRALRTGHADADAPISAVITRLHDVQYKCDIINSEQVLQASQELMSDALVSASPFFLWRPEELPQVVFGGYPTPYFDPAPFDNTVANAFVIPENTEFKVYGLAVMLYHETIPGHYLQIATSRQADIPLIQQLNGWPGYVEGWAEYASQLAYEQGWYGDDRCAILGYLETQLTIAALTAIETGLLGLSWGLDESVDYAQTIFDLPAAKLEPILSDFFYQPVQYVPYFVGRTVILDQRARAINELGDAFCLAEFHQAILQHGNVPLQLIGELVDDYISRVKGRTPAF